VSEIFDKFSVLSIGKVAAMSHLGNLSSDGDGWNEVKVQVIYAFPDVAVDFTISEEKIDVRIGLMQDIHSFVDEKHCRSKFVTG
jgi:hypothetical protein